MTIFHVRSKHCSYRVKAPFLALLCLLSVSSLHQSNGNYIRTGTRMQGDKTERNVDSSSSFSLVNSTALTSTPMFNDTLATNVINHSTAETTSGTPILSDVPSPSSQNIFATSAPISSPISDSKTSTEMGKIAKGTKSFTFTTKQQGSLLSGFSPSCKKGSKKGKSTNDGCSENYNDYGELEETSDLQSDTELNSAIKEDLASETDFIDQSFDSQKAHVQSMSPTSSPLSEAELKVAPQNIQNSSDQISAAEKSSTTTEDSVLESNVGPGNDSDLEASSDSEKKDPSETDLSSENDSVTGTDLSSGTKNADISQNYLAPVKDLVAEKNETSGIDEKNLVVEIDSSSETNTVSITEDPETDLVLEEHSGADQNAESTLVSTSTEEIVFSDGLSSVGMVFIILTVLGSVIFALLISRNKKKRLQAPQKNLLQDQDSVLDSDDDTHTKVNLPWQEASSSMTTETNKICIDKEVYPPSVNLDEKKDGIDAFFANDCNSVTRLAKNDESTQSKTSMFHDFNEGILIQTCNYMKPNPCMNLHDLNKDVHQSTSATCTSCGPVKTCDPVFVQAIDYDRDYSNTIVL